MAVGCQGGMMKESWLSAFKSKGKIVGDVVSYKRRRWPEKRPV